jgi:glycosyltransferase involved in cell wall biosynthesis
MIILQVTPGAGAMYCGNCLRDNTLVAALRKLGHQVTMVPLYLPLTLDEPDQTAGAPLFFSGLNVFLEQKAAWFRQAPAFVHRLLASPRLVKWMAAKASAPQVADLGELTLSMLRGEEGNQKREIDDLIAWLKTQPQPEAILLSNVLLIGLVRRLKAELRAPVICGLQGEDTFLDGLPEPYRATCWETLAERAAEADLFIAPSRYFGQVMGKRLGLAAGRVQVVWNGIDLSGYGSPEPSSPPSALSPPPSPSDAPRSLARRSEAKTATLPGASERSEDGHAPRPRTLGFFSRMCPEKGLDTLVEAFIQLRRRGRAELRLAVGGSCGRTELRFVASLRERLREERLLDAVEFHPNLDRAGKVEFLRSLTVFSVPAAYGEAFGLYVLEAWAAGVPVVQPRSGAFPELIEATGGGVLCPAGNPLALAQEIENLLLDPDRACRLGQAGRRAVFEKFSAECMARGMVEAVGSVKRDA